MTIILCVRAESVHSLVSFGIPSGLRRYNQYLLFIISKIFRGNKGNLPLHVHRADDEDCRQRNLNDNEWLRETGLELRSKSSFQHLCRFESGKEQCRITTRQHTYKQSNSCTDSC